MHRMHYGSSFLRNSFGNVVDSRTPCCKGSYGLIHRLPIAAEARELSRCINYERRMHRLMRLRIPSFDTIASKKIVMLRHNISKFGKVYAIILMSILALFLPNNRWKRDKAFRNRAIALAIGV